MRIWSVAGGTGGHVYPALAVAQALQAVAPEVALTWVGTQGGMEAELVARAGYRFLAIPAGGLHGVALLNAVRNGWQLTRGYFVARRHLRAERPAAVLTTGGFLSVPVAMAARSQGVPVLLFLPDIEPAQSVRTVARYATRIAVTVEDSRAYLPVDKVTVTGYPLRREFKSWSRDAGRAALELPSDERVLLVFGGSRGARSINRALLANIAAMTELAVIVHVTGQLDWEQVKRARALLPEAVQARYRAYAYLHDEMGAAIAAADLAICRAGASVLAEMPHFGVPSVLVPYPYAWRYQRVNADWLAHRGAAIVIEDAELPARMVGVTSDLLADASRLAAMSTAARDLARPHAAEQIATLLLSLAQGGAK